MNNTTPWRHLLYEELSKIKLEGSILDLGGSKLSGYHELIQGHPTISTVNMDTQVSPDFLLDLENPLPISGDKYDGILCINTLEHIFNYKELLQESKRLLKSGGTIVVAVPFLVQVHPSPNDYFRFSNQALERIFTDVGFQEVKIVPLGKGPFTARMQLIFNVLHVAPLRTFSRYVGVLLDSLLHATLRILGKKDYYTDYYYPLGYVALAKK